MPIREAAVRWKMTSVKAHALGEDFSAVPVKWLASTMFAVRLHHVYGKEESQ